MCKSCVSILLYVCGAEYKLAARRYIEFLLIRERRPARDTIGLMLCRWPLAGFLDETLVMLRSPGQSHDCYYRSFSFLLHKII